MVEGKDINERNKSIKEAEDAEFEALMALQDAEELQHDTVMIDDDVADCLPFDEMQQLEQEKLEQIKEIPIPVPAPIPIPIVSESGVKEESKKDEKEEYFTAKGGKKEKKEKKEKKDKDNYGDKGDKDQNNPYMYAKIIQHQNNPYMYAKIIQQDMWCIFWTIEDDRLCHIYDKNNGMYDAHGDARIRRMVQKTSDEEYRGVRENVKREVISIIKDRTSRPKPKDDVYDHLLLCDNGIYDLKERKFTKGFNPEFFITSRIPWIYNENAQCPDIKKFIIEVVVPEDRWTNPNNLDKKKILFIQELFGYCLYRRYPFHYMFMFLGRGDNGKGILLRIFNKFVGIENISAVPPHNLDKRFQSANLYGKHINMFGDLPGGKLRDTGTIKTLIGEDTVTAEFKGQDPFSFTSYAKIIVSTNEPFRVSYGEPEAFFRKILPIFFPNRFPPDDGLFERICTSEQMSGLLNFAIQGLERLLKNKEFSLKPIPKVVEDLFPRFGEKGEFHRATLDIRNVDITDIDIVYEQ